MWADWQVDNPADLSQQQKESIINQSRLVAGITAAIAQEDVDTAAQMAAEAVRWNANVDPNKFGGGGFAGGGLGAAAVATAKAVYQKINKKAVEDLRQGVFPGKGEIGQPREMPKSADPSKTADDFAQQYLGRKPTDEDFKRGSEMNGNNCQGCWRAQTADGTWVMYRPAGKAGRDTLPTTATVEINSKNIRTANNKAQLKLKFPKE